jgi:DNA-binding XRE family transcriptional regulator
MLDRNALKAEMTRYGYTQKQMADAIGISEKTFNLRLKNGVFGTDEVEKMIDVLHIKNPMAIFFAKAVT